MNGNSNLNNNVAPVNLEQPTPVTPNQGVQRPSVVTIPEAMLTVNHDETPVTPVQEPVQNAPQNVNTINQVNTQAQTGNVNQIVPHSVEAINNDDYNERKRPGLLKTVGMGIGVYVSWSLCSFFAFMTAAWWLLGGLSEDTNRAGVILFLLAAITVILFIVSIVLTTDSISYTLKAPVSKERKAFNLITFLLSLFVGRRR